MLFLELLQRRDGYLPTKHCNTKSILKYRIVRDVISSCQRSRIVSKMAVKVNPNAMADIFKEWSLFLIHYVSNEDIILLPLNVS